MYPEADIFSPFGAQYVNYVFNKHTLKTTNSWEARLPTTLYAYVLMHYYICITGHQSRQDLVDCVGKFKILFQLTVPYNPDHVYTYFSV